MRGMCFVGAVVLGLASSAQAHWQYTKWGMTPEEVVASSNGGAHLDPAAKPQDDGGINAVRGSYSAGGKTFDLSFMFRTGRLTGVTLWEKGNQSGCNDLKATLVGTYGSSTAEDATRTVRSFDWRDTAQQNYIRLVDTGLMICAISYSELPNAAKSGL